jgi:putative flavoprotein involved in K+ transport
MTERPLIVGAGAAGLAVAARMHQHGVECDVVDRATSVGSAWAGRYDSLHLHTIRWLSGLPGFSIPRGCGRWVARDDVVRYLHDYADRSGVDPELGVEVTRLDRAPDARGWLVETSAGHRLAPVVVLATSYSNRPYLPGWATQESAAAVGLVHSSQYRRPEPYRGRHVLVVGAGNSAAEIAVDLARIGAKVTMSVRTPPNIVRRDTLGVPSQLLGIVLRRVPEQVMNPLSAVLRRVSVPDLSGYGLPTPAGDGFTQFLRTRTVPILDHGFVQELRDGRIRIVAAVDSLDDGVVGLADGTLLRPDAIVCATGYRPGLEPIVGHLGVLDLHGTPLVHGARTLPSAPDLYFAGITVQLAGLLREIGFEAKAIGDAVARAGLASGDHRSGTAATTPWVATPLDRPAGTAKR